MEKTEMEKEELLDIIATIHDIRVDLNYISDRLKKKLPTPREIDGN